MSTEKISSNLHKLVLPGWADLIVVRNNRIIKVDWEGDFLLKEALEKPVANYKEIFKERSKLYSILHNERVILNLSSPGLSNGVRNLTLRVYEREKRLDSDGLFFREDYKIGPVNDGVIYSFNKIYRRIAQEWVDTYMKLNPDKDAFLPDR